VEIPVEAPLVLVARDGRIRWDGGMTQIARRRRKVDPLNDLLFGFTRLATATNDEILRYARDNGVLGLCRHGLPRAHVRQELGLDVDRGVSVCPPLGSAAEGVAEESMDRWRHYAAQMTALMVACDLVRHRQRPPPEIWLALSEYFPDFAQPAEEYGSSGTWPKRTRLPEGWAGDGEQVTISQIVSRRIWNRPEDSLSYVLRRWLDLGAVKPTIRWDRPSQRQNRRGSPATQIAQRNPATGLFNNNVGIDMQAGSLFGTLTLQVIAALAGAYRLRLCRNCLNVFGAGRSDQTYCRAPDCDLVRKAANRKRIRS
jgi:hypothetical protein